uniref:Uncharacterized protein n=1 Tax=Anguilla anguilla TaxID=7936 RepID=A0A0E9WVS0_ANGAN
MKILLTFKNKKHTLHLFCKFFYFCKCDCTGKVMSEK